MTVSLTQKMIENKPAAPVIDLANAFDKVGANPGPKAGRLF
jgi:hypothetical protein